MPTLATLKEQAVMSMLKLLNNYEPAHLFLPGTLGNAVGVVNVPGRAGYVYVRLLGDATRTIRARNMGIAAVADATVWVENVGSPGDRERYRIPLTDNTGAVTTITNHAVVSKTADYTATTVDELIIVDATSNTVTITLPTAIGITGRMYMIKCIDATYTVTVDGSGSQTIDGELTQTLSQWENLHIISNGANWLII